MSQTHESRPSSHPFIDRVWRSHNLTDGVYLATPDGSWDIIVGIEADGSRHAMIAGQATKPMNVPYSAGTSSVVISFAAGVYLIHRSAEDLLDSTEMLPIVDGDYFTFQGYRFPIPTYDTAEALVHAMTEAQLLGHDEFVTSALGDTPQAASARAFQRHFLKATGMTQKQLQQIRRAQEAVRRLQQGDKPIKAAVDAGYTDQPHLAKSLKKIMHARPSDVSEIHKL